MLTKITIKNYRPFAEFSMNSMARVNLIVGANNTGKSSLLETIHLLTSDDLRASLFYILNERGEFVASKYDPRMSVARQESGGYQVSHIFYGHSLKKRQSIEIAGNMARPRILNITVGEEQVTQQQLSLPDLDESELNEQINLLTLVRTEAHNIEVSHKLRLIEEGLLPYRPTRTIPSPKGKSRLLTTNYLGYEDLAVLWDDITLKPEEEQLIEALKILEPKVERISFTSSQTTNSGILLKLKGEREPVPLGSMGDGMRRILAITASLVNVGKGTLLVDEIDTSLHYRVLTDMWRLILETSLRQKAQVFATTHSWDCVRAFQQALHESKTPNLGRLIRLEKQGDQITTVGYSVDELDIAMQQAIEVR